MAPRPKPPSSLWRKLSTHTELLLEVFWETACVNHLCNLAGECRQLILRRSPMRRSCCERRGARGETSRRPTLIRFIAANHNAAGPGRSAIIIVVGASVTEDATITANISLPAAEWDGQMDLPATGALRRCDRRQRAVILCVSVLMSLVRPGPDRSAVRPTRLFPAPADGGRAGVAIVVRTADGGTTTGHRRRRLRRSITTCPRGGEAPAGRALRPYSSRPTIGRRRRLSRGEPGRAGRGAPRPVRILSPGH